MQCFDLSGFSLYTIHGNLSEIPGETGAGGETTLVGDLLHVPLESGICFAIFCTSRPQITSDTFSFLKLSLIFFEVSESGNKNSSYYKTGDLAMHRF